MDTNIVNDITDIYFEQIAINESKKAKPDYLDFDGDDDTEESMKKALKDKAKKAVAEGLKGNQDKIDVAPPYGKLTSADFKELRKGKKKKIKEGFSNWRQDLSEVIDEIENKKGKQKIKERNLDNTSIIKINPPVSEAVNNLGGTLIEMEEIKDFEEVFDELTESEIFLLSDDLIEKIVEEVFNECIAEGYDPIEIEDVLLESLEISSELLNEARVTHGHDTSVRSNRLEKVKSAVKKVGKKIVRGVGYAAGVAVRGAKAVGRELRAGYKRGRHGSGGGSEESSDSHSTSQSSSSSSGSSSSETGDSRPGLISRIGSTLKRGLKRVIAKGARRVAKGAIGVARRMEKEKPSSVHSRKGTRSSSPRSGIGGGKRVEVAGSGKSDSDTKEPEVKKVTVKDITPKSKESEVKKVTVKDITPKTKKSRTGYPGKDRPLLSPAKEPVGSEVELKPKKKATSVSKVETDTQTTPKSRRARRRKGGPSVAEVKAKIDAKEQAKKEAAEKRRKANQLLKDLAKEEFQLSEKAESKQQQKIFGLALSVKRGETPRSEVSAEVLKIVDSMSEKKIRDFAKTSHEGLPKKVQTKEEAIREALLAKMIEKIEEQSETIQSDQSKTSKPKNLSAISSLLTAKSKADTAQKDLAVKQRVAAQRGVNLSTVSSSYEPEGEIIDETKLGYALQKVAQRRRASGDVEGASRAQKIATKQFDIASDLGKQKMSPVKRQQSKQRQEREPEDRYGHPSLSARERNPNLR